MAVGEGWRVVDVVCTSGPRDRPSSLMSSGSVLLGNAGQAYECSHEHGEGDRCLSFQFEPLEKATSQPCVA